MALIWTGYLFDVLNQLEDEGLVMFGIAGFIAGPIIAALFITIWEIYGEVFKEVLPKLEMKDET